MMQKIIVWANNNQGLVALLIFLAGSFGYFLKKILFGDRSGKTLIQKQKGGDNSANVQAGRDVNIPK